MIISKTPFRISFFGGGTDYPAWYRKHGGMVLATTIDKYCYISCRRLPPFFGYNYRVVYSKIENINQIEEIEHPSVKACLQDVNNKIGLEIHHDGDLPARSGLGSSSSFTVGMLHALSAFMGKYVSKDTLARQAMHVEQDLIKEHVGSQDQISAAYGGFNKIQFFKNGNFSVEPVIVSNLRQAELENHLMLFFTGIQRNSQEAAKSKIENLSNCVEQLEQMRGMVIEALDLLQHEQRSITGFGELLDHAWEIKRSLSDKVSTPFIDELYQRAKNAGAIGGKLLGAGGGGFLLLFAKPSVQGEIKRALHEFIHVPVRFEDSGTKIVLYQPNGLI